MIKVFVDCDIIIDLLTRREPHFYESAKFFQQYELGKTELITSPLAIANVHYITRKTLGSDKSKEVIQKLLQIISLSELTQDIVNESLKSQIYDFEDAIQSISARNCSCIYIVSRNVKDYKKSDVPAKTPSEINQLLGTDKSS